MKNVQICYIRVTEGKIENLKKDGFKIHFAYLKLYTKFNNPKSSSC